MKSVELGRPNHPVAVGRDVAIAHVIDENDDNVGLLLGRGGVRHGVRSQEQGSENCEGVFHGVSVNLPKRNAGWRS
jgi:hypothetical protein